MCMEEHTCLHSEPAEKGCEKKKKNPGINPGQRYLKYTEADSAIECKARTVMSQTDRPTQLLY
jgi:hypothetical protein